MSTYESLVENLLVLKPNLQRSEVTKLVEAKKRRVGGGYLTDQGAIYLVASDLGVALERPSSDLGVKDLYIGAGEITVVTRLLGAYPVKSFSKKNGEEGCYRRLIIFEGEHNANLTCWDERAKLADELGLKSGDLIKIYKGYVRAGLDGSAALNLSEKGSIEKILENNELELKVAGLDSITKSISEIGSHDSHFVIKCTLKSPSKISEFVRKDGSAGSVHNLYVAD
ncbi:MAG: hypothetical protein ACE5KG_03155, partial [Nitrososphaerales archaeon]